MEGTNGADGLNCFSQQQALQEAWLIAKAAQTASKTVTWVLPANSAAEMEMQVCPVLLVEGSRQFRLEIQLDEDPETRIGEQIQKRMKLEGSGSLLCLPLLNCDSLN